MMPIIIKNGTLIDPAGKLSPSAEQEPLLISEGYIRQFRLLPGAITVDASGMYVVPGLIDFHTHLFSASELGVHPAFLPSSGVTAAVDAGTSGSAGFENFYQTGITSSPIPIRAFLNLFSEGIVGTMGLEECTDPSRIDVGKISYLFQKYPQTLLGLKIRISRSIVKEFGLAPLLSARKLADRLETRLCVHVTDPPAPVGSVLSLLSRGDILCHVFHGKGHTILDNHESVSPCLFQARDRGILFDDANGRANFSFSVARKAIRQGFLPDIISTDTTSYSFQCSSSVRTLPYHMSKYLNMGVELEKIMEAVTTIPARCMNAEDQIGSLSPGFRGNITLLKEIRKPTVFTDASGAALTGDRLLIPVMCILDGHIVYCHPEYDFPPS